jgi:hypothetical protein
MLMVIIFLSINRSIHDWGTKKMKNDSKTFVGLLFTNNIYLKQI